MIAKTQPAPTSEHSEDFSLVLGGPLYQLLVRSGLIKPPFGRLSSRILVLTGVAWLPLILLTILGGRFAQGVPVPFIRDFEVHARLLFSLPMLVLAELVVYIRMRAIISQFLERRIVTPDIRPAFNSIISSAMRLRNSTVDGDRPSDPCFCWRSLALAGSNGSADRHLVRVIDDVRSGIHSSRMVVRVHQYPDIPVHSAPVVLPSVYLVPLLVPDSPS